MFIKREEMSTDESQSSMDFKEEEVEISQLLIPVKKEQDEEEEMGVSEAECSAPTAAPLSAISRVRYESNYQNFLRWCNKRGFNNYTDEDVLLEYFKELIAPNKKNAWTFYSMLKSCILIHNNVDISRFSRLLAYLKSHCPYVQAKKSRALSEYHINLFVDQADDEEFLLMKVALIIGVSGGLHGRQLCNLVIDNLEIKSDLIAVTIPVEETNKSRRFIIMNSKWVAVIKKYLHIRLKVSKISDRFFINYQRGQCTGTPMGKTAIAKIPSKIAKFLNLDNPDEYTAHCFRRSSTPSLLVQMSAPAAEGNSLKITQICNNKKSTADKETNTEPPQTSAQVIIDCNNTVESERLLAGLFSNVQDCKIVVNVYNNCHVSK